MSVEYECIYWMITLSIGGFCAGACVGIVIGLVHYEKRAKVKEEK